MTPGDARATRQHFPRRAGLSCMLVAGLLACSNRSAAAPTTLSIFAAASLGDAFGELGRQFEAQHPRVDVRLSTAGSQVLRLQIEQGARADVFASADRAHVSALGAGGFVTRSELLAHNALALVVPVAPSSPLGSFADLPRAQRLVIGTAAVPVGAYTRTLLERAAERFGPAWVDEVKGHVASEESNVRLLRAKVELGEADAAIVYESDAAEGARVRRIEIPAELAVRADYLIAPLRRSHHPALAAAFVAYAMSRAGRAVLRRHGFSVPP